MQLPPSLETKFNELAGRYPVKRSALIPMMLYAQDDLGSLGDEILAEIAKRLDLNTIQVTETMAYYSMLRRKPVGKYHVQVCTLDRASKFKAEEPAKAAAMSAQG